MASTILSDNGVTSGSAGLKTTAASDGALALQTTTSGGTATTALTIDTSQNTTLAGTLTTTGITNSGVATATRFNPTGSSVTGNGMYLPAANSLGLSTNGTNAVYIDTSQRVGIGTTAPNKPLSVYGGDGYIQMLNASTGTGNTDGAFIGVEGGTTSLRIVNQENDAISFSTNGLANERMRITSAGNVGIGLTSPSQKLDVSGEAQLTYAGGTNYLYFISTGNYVGRNTTGDIWLNAVGGQSVVFGIGGSEAARVDANSNFLVGTTSTVSGARVVIKKSNAERIIQVENTRNTSGDQTYRSVMGTNCNDTSSYHFIATTGGADKYYLYGNGTYGTISDQRLKKNIETARDGYLEDLARLRVVKYNWTEDAENAPKELGWIAQEVEQVFAGLVQDGLPNEDGDTYKQVKTSVLPFMLLKSIQELKAINDTQAETINALTARIVALEQA